MTTDNDSRSSKIGSSLRLIMIVDFYRAMHFSQFSAKRGIAIACRLSVCLSVRL